ncbi:hypothetical protein [Afipia sp. GAS231]|uniref:hypothetical protein n=1 Tax=Afipia sp. GAS231 TaxID=1882747 RepID=UPI000B87C11F
MQGLSLSVQEGLGRDPFAVFRRRGGSLIKTLWHDGIGLSLYRNAESGVDDCSRGSHVRPSSIIR